MNSHAPVLFPAFFGITQLWNEFDAVRPAFGPDCGNRASYQEIAGVRVPFSDLDEAARALGASA